MRSGSRVEGIHFELRIRLFDSYVVGCFERFNFPRTRRRLMRVNWNILDSALDGQNRRMSLAS